MKKEPELFLNHILESIQLIEEYTEDKEIENFLRNKQLQDSVIRRIEIIGEAVKNLNTEIKDRYPDVPWKDIAGMRDVVVHGYFGVDPYIVWKVIERDIPHFKVQIEKIISELGK